MSASLVSLFHFFLVSSEPLFPSVISLLKEEKTTCPPTSSLLNKSLSLFRSVSSSLFFSHTPTYHPQRWQAPAHPACCILSSQRRWAINHMIWWFLLQACLSGSGGRNLYSGRYGQFQNFTSSGGGRQPHTGVIYYHFSPFSGKRQIRFASPSSRGERRSILIADFKAGAHWKRITQTWFYSRGKRLVWGLIWQNLSTALQTQNNRKLRTNKP